MRREGPSEAQGRQCAAVIRASFVGWQVASGVRSADFQAGELVERPVENQVRKKNRGLQRIADHVAQSTFAREAFIEFRNPLRMHEDEAAEFFGFAPKGIEFRIRQFVAVDMPTAPSQRELLLAPGKTEVAMTIEGKPLKFTSLNKLYYPKDNVTKRDVINYSDAVADLLIPYWKDRPLSMRR